MRRVALVVLVGCARPPVVFEPAPGFDHSFAPLVGAHAGVGCASCHLFRFVPPAFDRCETCHASTHTGLYAGRECTACHAPTRAFARATFEHPRFTLGAGHAKVACAACHASTDKAPTSTCESCHADRHAGRFKGLRCDACHSPAFTASTPRAVWRPNQFDHLKLAKLALTYEHAEISCRDCHRGADPAEFERFSTPSCVGCHAHRAVHDRKYKDGDCSRCHMHPGEICRHP